MPESIGNISSSSHKHDDHVSCQNVSYIEVVPKYPVLGTMLAGGIAGCVSKTAMAPLSRLTILYQVDSALHSGSSSSSRIRAPLRLLNMNQLIRRLIQEEGVASLWKGNFTSVLHRFPYSAINFSVYELTKDILMKSGSADLQETATIRFMAGAVGAAAACIICYPLDLLRTRLTLHDATVFNVVPEKIGSSHTSSLHPSFSLHHSAIVQTYRSILRTEGVRGLYRGMGVSLSVCVPTLSIGFSAYGTAKQYLLQSDHDILKNRSGKGLNVIGSLLCGASSGLCSSTLLFPADVIRRRMQVRGLLFAESLQSLPVSEASRKFDGHVIGEIAQLYGKEGVRGFYRGIAPELLKVIPAVGITFCVYEMMLRLLER